MKRYLAFLLLLTTTTGCTLGYRHQVVSDTFPGPTAELSVEGTRDVYHMGLVLDFLFVRLGIPYEVLKSALAFEDSLGGKNGDTKQAEQKTFRIEVPALSVWNNETGLDINYPGLLRKRQSVELWFGADSDLRTQPSWWAEAGLTYYHYNMGAVYLFGGYGETPFKVSTLGVGPEFPNTWSGQAGSWGAGISVTIFAGEHALELFEYILDIDQKHRKKYK